MSCFHGRVTTMDIKCPHCGTEYDVEKQDMYRYTKCEVCGKGFIVGADTSLLSSKPSPPKPSSPTPSTVPRAPTSSTPPRRRETPAQRPRPSAAKSFASGMRSLEKPTADTSAHLPPHITEAECLKAWAIYWVERLLIIVVVSSVVGIASGFIASITGTAPFMGWPKEGEHRVAHILAYAVMGIGVYGIYELAFLSYRRCAVRMLFMGQQTCNVVSSWIIPILVNVALGLLMPANIQIAVLGIYGYVVWALTIWVVVDYCMFRFVSVRLLFGQKVDSRWICPAVLFCIFIVVMYGFARIVENDGIRHHDASQIYDRMKQMDDSRHHDAEQIYDRMGRMKLY